MLYLRGQVEEAPWTAIWMQIPGYALLAAYSPIEETGRNVLNNKGAWTLSKLG